MKRILLLSMPFGALERPSLGLSLLKARLTGEGFACDIRYLTFTFAEYIGHDVYQWMSYELPYTAFAGDWTFTSALYGDDDRRDRTYKHEILRETWHLQETDIQRIAGLRPYVPHFLRHCLDGIPWNDYAIVGFTSTFEQNISSLALAKRVKALHPSTTIVFGGANWEAEMGQELHARFPFVDFVCSGESEDSFPALVRHVMSGATAPPTSIAGVVYRSEAGVTASTGPAEPTRNLDSLPYPDFSDYFHALEQSSVGVNVVPTLLFETSRGCWWGAKSHCTFCGLNGQTMAFRSKTPRRALEELEYLTERWRTEQVSAVDNILDMKYFATMLPALAEVASPIQLFYEVKANLSKAQVMLLRDAGVNRIQPGIESLSDHVLKLMRKGTTGLRNVQLLKWAQEYGVAAEWNILYGFPGETPEDYARIMDMLPAIRFLRPPCATGPIRLDRFSPYHTSPEEHGLTNLRPMAIYRHLYPFDTESLRRIAYYFDFDYQPGLDPTGYATDVIAYTAAWRRDQDRGTLSAIPSDNGTLTIVDTRPERTVSAVQLSGLEQAAYDYCDSMHSVGAVARELRERFPNSVFGDDDVKTFLDSLVANRLMVTDGVNYLSLAIPVRPPRVQPDVSFHAGGRTAERASRHVPFELRITAAPGSTCGQGAQA
jgi:ribosomal peptide maturation radical SAM protein 1